MIEIPTGLPAELVPLSWLIGVWEGTGVIDYTVGETKVTREFGQRISFSHDSLPFLNYSAHSWLLPTAVPGDAEGESAEQIDEAITEAIGPLTSESGYWRIARPLVDADQGPAMLPGTSTRPFSTTAAVETLRNAAGGFDVELTLAHPGGVAELYFGSILNARIDLASDAVISSVNAKPYSAATRLYGLVDSHLLWAWDIAALGQDLRTHASARLAKVD